jgi:hypothetical protein
MTSNTEITENAPAATPKEPKRSKKGAVGARGAHAKSRSPLYTRGLLPPIKWELPTFSVIRLIEALWKSGFTIA